MRVIATHPETSEVGRPTTAAVREVLAAYFARRSSRADEFEVACLAGAVTTVAFEATLQWATTQMALQHLMQRAVNVLDMRSL